MANDLSHYYTAAPDIGTPREICAEVRGVNGEWMYHSRGPWSDAVSALRSPMPGYSGGLATFTAEDIRISLDQRERRQLSFGKPLSVDAFLVWATNGTNESSMNPNDTNESSMNPNESNESSMNPNESNEAPDIQRYTLQDLRRYDDDTTNAKAVGIRGSKGYVWRAVWSLIDELRDNVKVIKVATKYCEDGTARFDTKNLVRTNWRTSPYDETLLSDTFGTGSHRVLLSDTDVHEVEVLTKKGLRLLDLMAVNRPKAASVVQITSHEGNHYITTKCRPKISDGEAEDEWSIISEAVFPVTALAVPEPDKDRVRQHRKYQKTSRSFGRIVESDSAIGRAVVAADAHLAKKITIRPKHILNRLVDEKMLTVGDTFDIDNYDMSEDGQKVLEDIVADLRSCHKAVWTNAFERLNSHAEALAKASDGTRAAWYRSQNRSKADRLVESGARIRTAANALLALTKDELVEVVQRYQLTRL